MTMGKCVQVCFIAAAIAVMIAGTHAQTAQTCNFTNHASSTILIGSGTFDTNTRSETNDYLSNQQCMWAAQCTPNYGGMYMTVKGHTMGSGDSLTIANPTTQAVIATMYGYVDRRIYIPLVYVGMLWSTDASGQSYGLKITFECINRQCFSDNASDVYGSDYAGKLVSDSDGKKCATMYTAGESCNWRLKCNSTYPYMLVKTTGLTRPTDKLSVIYQGTTYPDTGRVDSAFLVTSDFNMTFAPLVSSDTTQGFDIDYQCFTRQCTSATSGQTFTADSGTITSDTDGKGNDVYYSLEVCSWRIKCATKNYLRLVFNGALASGDLLRMQDATGKNILNYDGGFDAAILYTGDVTFAFTPNGFASGFTIDYTCLASPCASPNGTGVTFTAASGTLVSDADGVGTNVLTELWNQCSWSISCPAGSQYLSLRWYGNTVYNGNYITVTDTASNTFWGQLNSNDAMYFRPVTISWVTNASEAMTGFALRYVCSPEFCTSPTASQLLTATSGTFASDSDGYGSEYYWRNETCTWTVSCPANTVARLSTFAYRTSGYDTLRFYDAFGNTLMTPTSYYTGISGSFAFYSSSNVLVTKLFASLYSSSYYSGGLNAAYDCVSSTCGASRAPGTITDSTGIITNNVNTTSSTTMAYNENCTWTIQCPTTQYVMLRPYAANGASMTIKTPNNTYFYSSTAPTPLMTLFSTVSVNLVSSPSLYNNVMQYLLNWTCQSSTCSSTTAPGSYTSSTGIISSSPGVARVYDAFNGYNLNYNHYANELCQWNIQCPTGNNYVAWNVSGSFDGTFVVTVGTTSYTTSSGIAGIFAGSTLSVTFRASSSSSGSSQYQFGYRCLPTNCTSTTQGTTFTTSAGSINTDFDGSAATAYNFYPGEVCSWAVTCAATDKFMVFFPRSGGGYQSIFFADTWVSSSTMYGLYIANASSSAVRVYSTESYLMRYGVSVDYACSTRYCTSRVPSGVVSGVTEGVIVSDWDGTGYQGYARGEDCAWTIQCPTGYTYIGVAVETSFARDTVLTLTDGAAATKTFTYTTGSYYHYYTAPLSVSFTSSMWYYPSYGFTLRYECRKWPCSAQLESHTSIKADRTNEILSTAATTFTAANYFADNEECDWDLVCPAGSNIVVNRLLVSTTTTYNELKFYLPNNTCINYTLNAADGFQIGTHYAKMRWSTEIAAPRSTTSFGMKYTCSQRRCSSSSNDTNRIIGLGSGTIRSDWDGSSSTYKYLREESCAWTIECDADKSLSLSVSGTTTKGDYVKLQSFDGQETWVTYDGNINRQFIAYGNKMRVSFDKNSSTAVNDGFTITYTCFIPNCTSYGRVDSHLLADTNHTVKSNNSFQCFWHFTCPGPNDVMLLHVTANMSSTESLKFLLNDSDTTYSWSCVKDRLWNRNSRTTVIYTTPARIANNFINIDHRCFANGAGRAAVSALSLLSLLFLLFLM